MASIYKKATLKGGAFQDNQGNPLSLGKLTWQLYHDGSVYLLAGTTGSQVIAGITTTIYLDMNGNISGSPTIWTNDVLFPTGSYYTVRAYNNLGIEVWMTPQIFSLTYSATIDVGTLIPLLP